MTKKRKPIKEYRQSFTECRTDQLVEEVIERELHFEKLPLWHPPDSHAKPKVQVFEYTVLLPDEWKVENVWPVGLHARATLTVGYTSRGMLTTEDRRVYDAMVQIWAEQGRPPTDFPFSRRQLADILSLPFDEANFQAIDSALGRLSVTPFYPAYVYQSRDAKVSKRVMLSSFNILQDCFRYVNRSPDRIIKEEGGECRLARTPLQYLLAETPPPQQPATVLPFSALPDTPAGYWRPQTADSDN